MARLPPWIRVRLAAGDGSARVERLLRRGGLHTVCQSAQCPNRHECFARGTAAFMILGDVCTRDCAFCAIATGRPAAPDPDEPVRVAEAARELRLEHVVLTSVTRDDLPDGGAAHFAATVAALRRRVPQAGVETLAPDFGGCARSLETLLEACPDVFNHNLETVRRLQRQIRPAAGYERSLAVLAQAARRAPATIAKSGLMVGLGETDGDVYDALADLRQAGCEMLTIGQYLAPSARHAPVRRFVTPEQFGEYGRRARAMGFRAVASGPLVRSSYRAGALWLQAVARGAPALREAGG